MKSSLPTLPLEVINIIMSYIIKRTIYKPLTSVKKNIDYMNIFYNNSISFSKYFFLKHQLMKKTKLVD